MANMNDPIKGLPKRFAVKALLCATCVAVIVGCKTKPPEARTELNDSASVKSPPGESARMSPSKANLATRIMSVLSTSDVAGFDTNALQPVQKGNSLKPFMLLSHAKYYDDYRGLAGAPAFDALQQRILKDSGQIGKNFQNAALILGRGMPLSGHPPFAAVLFCNDSSGILYWMALDTPAVKQFPLPRAAPGLLHAIVESRPGSVDEIGSEDDQFAFVAMVASGQTYAVIWSPRESTLGGEYDQALIFKPKMSETGFRKRKMVDSLLSIVGKEADRRGWGEVW